MSLDSLSSIILKKVTMPKEYVLAFDLEGSGPHVSGEERGQINSIGATFLDVETGKVVTDANGKLMEFVTNISPEEHGYKENTLKHFWEKPENAEAYAFVKGESDGAPKPIDKKEAWVSFHKFWKECEEVAEKNGAKFIMATDCAAYDIAAASVESLETGAGNMLFYAPGQTWPHDKMPVDVNQKMATYYEMTTGKRLDSDFGIQDKLGIKNTADHNALHDARNIANQYCEITKKELEFSALNLALSDFAKAHLDDFSEFVSDNKVELHGEAAAPVDTVESVE